MFAALTIVCMLTFVMASGVSGAGDFFSEMQRLIVGGGKYPEVAKLYGSRVDLQEIRILRSQRLLANQYIRQAVMVAQSLIISEVQKDLRRKDSEYDSVSQKYVEEALNARMFSQFGQQFVDQYLQKLPEYIGQFGLGFVEDSLQKQKKTAQAEDIRRLRAALAMDSWLMRPKNDALYSDSNLYFGGSLSPQGLLDFLIWKHRGRPPGNLSRSGRPGGGTEQSHVWPHDQGERPYLGESVFSAAPRHHPREFAGCANRRISGSPGSIQLGGLQPGRRYARSRPVFPLRVF